MDWLLHSGLEHPELWWIVVPGMLSFLLGLVAFVFSERVRSWFGTGRSVTD